MSRNGYVLLCSPTINIILLSGIKYFDNSFRINTKITCQFTNVLPIFKIIAYVAVPKIHNIIETYSDTTNYYTGEINENSTLSHGIGNHLYNN